MKIPKLFFTAFCLLFFPISLNAQRLSKVYKTNGLSAFEFVFETSTGFDAFGYTIETNQSGIQSQYILFVKLDSCGKVISSIRYGLGKETIKAVILNSNGNYTLIAKTGSYNPVNFMDNDILAMNISNTGIILKSVTIEHPNNYIKSIDCVISSRDGGYIVSEKINNSIHSTNDNMGLLKLDNNLNPIWFKNYTYNSNSIEGETSLVELPSGNLITLRSDRFDSTIVYTKLNSSGNVIFSKKLKNSQNTSILRSSHSKGLYNNGSCCFKLLESKPSIDDFLILKIDTNANTIWCKKYSGAINSPSISMYQLQAHDNKIYVSGRDINNSRRGYLTSLDTNGSVEWSKLCAKGNYSASVIINTTLTNSGSLISCGSVINWGISPSNMHPFINMSDTSKNLRNCEENFAMNVTNYGISSSVFHNPTVANSFNSQSQIVSSINLIVEDTLVCPWKQKDTTICSGDSILISNQYQKVAGIYPDSLISTYGCDSIVMRNLILSNIGTPIVSLGPDRILCQGDSLILKNSHITSSSKLWQDGSSLDSFVVYTSGEYWLIEQNQCGESKDTVQIILENLKPQVDLGNDTTLCDGDQITLQNKIPSTLDKLWQDGSTTVNFVVNNPGEYWLKEQNDCGESIDTILVNYNSPPQVDLGNDTTLCDGDQITLQNKIPNTLDKLWQDGSTTVNFVVNNPGKYWLKEQNDCGETRDTIIIRLEPDPFISLGNDTSICIDENIQLIAQTNGTEIIWDDLSTQLTRDVDQEGIYWAMAKSQKGCESSDTIKIETIDCNEFELEMPNVFTPNHDQLNNVFSPIRFKGIETVHLQIFNRWGEKLFETNNLEKGWDGMNNKKPVPEGEYFWILEYRKIKDTKPKNYHISGLVSIIR